MAVLLAGCVAPYDEQTDEAISALQQETDAEIVRLITLDHKIGALSAQDVSNQATLTAVCTTVPPGNAALADACGKASYDQNTDFYDKFDTDLTSLKLRLDAAPDASTPSLDNLLTQLRNIVLSPQGGLKSLHAKRVVLNESALTSTRAPLNALFQTLLRYELNLKNGKSTS
ncbi:MAG: hypothetical protein JO157_09910 [Acetobacteraceae bacterium]|nr:hypothetical protein [Acetobacteraceae bacterium]